MIERRGGLFDLLDEECIIPKGTDESFLNKIRKQINHDNFIAQGDAPNRFGLKHFAGSVHYEADNFLEKNKDSLYITLINLMTGSRMKLANDLFDNDAEQSKKGPAKRPLTASFQFKNQVRISVVLDTPVL